MPRKTCCCLFSFVCESGFNEAAARCRGKLQRPGDLAAARKASMRPRPDAAENRLLLTRAFGWFIALQ